MKAVRRLARFQAADQTRTIVKRALLTLKDYDPANEKIEEFHRTQAFIRALFGGNQSGKTESGIYELLRPCFTEPAYPEAQVWACTISNEMIGRILWPKMQLYLPPSSIKHIAWLNPSRRIPGIIFLSTGWQIHCKSYEQKREAFQGAYTVRRILLDEECEEPIKEECLARLITRKGDLLLTMTPLKGLTWAYHDVYKLEGKDPDVRCWTISLLENKHLPSENKERFVKRLSADARLRRVDGLFVRLSGVVFKEFGEHNIIEPFLIPEDWPKIRAIDFGYADPFVCLWLARGTDGKIYIYNEHYQNETLLKDHARIIRAKDREWLIPTIDPPIFEATVADHDAQDRAELNALGISTTPARKENLRERLELINNLCVRQENGQPGLYVFNHCAKTREEWERYRYKEETQTRNITEVPVDKDNHTCDAGGYGIMFWKWREIDLDAFGMGIPLLAGTSNTSYSDNIFN